MTIESALVVLIPEAENLVGRFRNRYDPGAALGLPAHVTILYPFKPPSEVTSRVTETLSQLFSRISRFDSCFNETKFFPRVLYLAPEPAELFQALTKTVVGQFPENPPYCGQFDEVIP